MNRDHYYDNLRIVLIALVVAGHFALTYLHGASSRSIDVLKDWIWLFHMPAFLFVSGMFAKRLYTRERGLDVDAICYFLVMYLLFSVVIQLVMSTYSNPVFDPFHVYRIPWYFLALAILGSSLPFVANVRGGARVVVSAAIAFAFVAGFNEGFGSFLSLGRIVNFAPFYFLGYFLDMQAYKDIVSRIRSRRSFIVVDVMFLVGVYAGLWIAPDEVASTMSALSFAYSPYASCGDLPIVMIAGMRLMWFALAFGMMLGVSALVPAGKTVMSDLGTRTLQVYLVHPLIYLPLRGFDVIPAVVPEPLLLGGWTVIAFSIALTFALAYPKRPAIWLKRFQKSIHVDIRHENREDGA